jgi:beta-aspartyl-peptidase (threonine type)
MLVGSANAAVGMPAAMAVVLRGGGLLEAVEAGIRLVEENPLDNSVGLGGVPNVRGEVELDASIMEGESRRAGAVGALRGYRNAISVARRVMEASPHVLIVGEGAGEIAAAMGLQNEDLLTDESRRLWREGPETMTARNAVETLDSNSSSPPNARHFDITGTVNLIARDAYGHLVVGVSTSGQGWKYRGRLGDSPIIGAGNYCDDRYGACACTGLGELSLRASTAHTVVMAMKQGLSVEDACVIALHDLDDLSLVAPDSIVMDIVAVDAAGEYCAATTRSESWYAYQTDAMSDPLVARRIVVKPSGTRSPELL